MTGIIPLTMLFDGFFALVFGGIGLYLLARFLKAYRKADASQSWPSTTGHIEVSRVQFKDSHGAEINTYTSYLPVVEYTYAVMGTQYRGKRIGFSMDITVTRSQAVKVIARYPAGTEAAVYYDPQNPGEAVLEQKMGNTFVTLVMIGIFLILGFSAVYFLSRTILSENLFPFLK
jgi:hypothetical protein